MGGEKLETVHSNLKHIAAKGIKEMAHWLAKRDKGEKEEHVLLRERSSRQMMKN